MCNSYITVRLF